SQDGVRRDLQPRAAAEPSRTPGGSRGDLPPADGGSQGSAPAPRGQGALMGRPLLVLSPARLVSLLLVLVLVAILAMFAALCAGSVDIGAREVLAALSGSGNGMGAQVVLELRLPRVLAGFVVGGMLAFAGALMQVLLRNPLA